MFIQFNIFINIINIINIYKDRLLKKKKSLFIVFGLRFLVHHLYLIFFQRF